MRKKLFSVVIIGLLMISLTGCVNNSGKVYLKIDCDGKDISNKFVEGDKFNCELFGDEFEITIKKVEKEKITLKADRYGLFQERDDGTYSLIDDVDEFEVVKGKTTALALQVTDASATIKIDWK